MYFASFMDIKSKFYETFLSRRWSREILIINWPSVNCFARACLQVDDLLFLFLGNSSSHSILLKTETVRL